MEKENEPGRYSINLALVFQERQMCTPLSFLSSRIPLITTALSFQFNYPELDMDKFVDEQVRNNTFKQACKEIAKGRKEGCWIWFVIPTPYYEYARAFSKEYSLKSKAEAIKYLAFSKAGVSLRDNYLKILKLIRKRMRKHGDSLEDIFHWDAVKVESSLRFFLKIVKKGPDEELTKVLKSIVRRLKK